MTRLSLLLGFSALGVAGVAAELAMPGDPLATLPTPAPVALPTATKAKAGVRDAATLTEVTTGLTQRPLFRPGRRAPPSERTETVSDAPSERPRLAGVIIGPAGRTAIFAGADGKSVAVAPGSSIGRFSIKTILPDRVTLAGPDGEIDVRPTFLKPGK